MAKRGYIQHWNNQEHEETQVTLFGGSQPLVQSDEPGRVAANKALQREVQSRGGNEATHAEVNRVVAKNVLGHSVKEVCDHVGVDNRSQLPTPAKEALMVGDIAARNQIQADDARGHEGVVESAQKGSQKARNVFSW